MPRASPSTSSSADLPLLTVATPLVQAPGPHPQVQAPGPHAQGHTPGPYPRATPQVLTPGPHPSPTGGPTPGPEPQPRCPRKQADLSKTGENCLFSPRERDHACFPDRSAAAGPRHENSSCDREQLKSCCCGRESANTAVFGTAGPTGRADGAGRRAPDRSGGAGRRPGATGAGRRARADARRGSALADARGREREHPLEAGIRVAAALRCPRHR